MSANTIDKSKDLVSRGQWNRETLYLLVMLIEQQEKLVKHYLSIAEASRSERNTMREAEYLYKVSGETLILSQLLELLCDIQGGGLAEITQNQQLALDNILDEDDYLPF